MIAAADLPIGLLHLMSIGDHSRGEVPPDMIEPVVGFRQWRLREDKLLSPYASSIVWDESPLRAQCMPGLFPVRGTSWTHSTPAPARHCACGIYAYFEPCMQWELVYNVSLVPGAVILWGRIEVHRGGMRGQYARAICLASPRRALRHGAIQRAAGRLGIELVEDIRDLKQVALRYGRPLPDGFTPD